MSGGPEPVPAVREDEAQGETAALFAEIRRALGVPVVNLVWRHLATVPGALDWAWGALRPVYLSGAAEREGAILLGALPLPRLSAWSRSTLHAAGVDEAAWRTVVTVLDTYNRSNAMNLVALSALGLGLDGRPGARPTPTGAVASAGGRVTVAGGMPQLLTLDQMGRATAEMVRHLDRLGERVGGRVSASMYRHLAHWPGFLALARALIEPLDRDGRLGGLIDTAHHLARTAAERLIGELGMPGPTPEPGTGEAVRRVADAFTGGVIAKMVPICALLRRAMPD